MSTRVCVSWNAVLVGLYLMFNFWSKSYKVRGTHYSNIFDTCADGMRVVIWGVGGWVGVGGVRFG